MKKKSANKARLPKKRSAKRVNGSFVDGLKRPFLRQIFPLHILSFGDQSRPIDLNRLTVLIGPNGSGKSNLLDLLDLMREAPDGLRDGILRGGGVLEWMWKGERVSQAAYLQVRVDNDKDGNPLQHYIIFAETNQAFSLRVESVVSLTRRAKGYTPNRLLVRSDEAFNLKQEIPKRVAEESHSLGAALSDKQWWKSAGTNVSMLEDFRDPENYPELTFLTTFYKGIRLYRQWSFGRETPLRRAQSADARSDFLEEDFSNLGLVLNRLRKSPATKRAIIDHLKDLYEGLTDFDVSVEGGSVLVYLTEGEFTIPAVRLSDGTLRYLGLLALLCDPNPPPLIGIEEPELGLHPDLIPKIADLLKEASGRCQLIVTTHSDILVSALSDCPESIIVCEKHDGQTTMRHLDPEELKPWLEKYRLGELWTRGQIGGVRW